MSGNAFQIRTFYRAVDVCGGVEALASALEVSVEELYGWLGGTAVATVKAYITVLDLVAGGRDTGR